MVDDFTREALALVVDSSLGGARAGRELDALIGRRGRPATIVSDNGTALTSRVVLEWTNRTGIEWVDWFNNRRLLEPIGNVPPAEAEARYYAILEQSDMAA